MAIITGYLFNIDMHAGVLIKTPYIVVKYIWYFYKIANCKDKKSIWSIYTSLT